LLGRDFEERKAEKKKLDRKKAGGRSKKAGFRSLGSPRRTCPRLSPKYLILQDHKSISWLGHVAHREREAVRDAPGRPAGIQSACIEHNTMRQQNKCLVPFIVRESWAPQLALMRLVSPNPLANSLPGVVRSAVLALQVIAKLADGTLQSATFT